MPAAGVGVAGSDVYLNVAGGLKIARARGRSGRRRRSGLVLRWTALAARLRIFRRDFSLSGDIRPVPQAEARLKEAAKLGFKQAFIPARHQGGRGSD